MRRRADLTDVHAEEVERPRRHGLLGIGLLCAQECLRRLRAAVIERGVGPTDLWGAPSRSVAIVWCSWASKDGRTASASSGATSSMSAHLANCGSLFAHRIATVDGDGWSQDALAIWFRGEGSNLHLGLQRPASCR